MREFTLVRVPITGTRQTTNKMLSKERVTPGFQRSVSVAVAVAVAVSVAKYVRITFIRKNPSAYVKK